ncbi:hypothetical protein WJX81_003226 [Elliptochloris bilobata]|uniref:HTH TFE/IIEalpha-type domain-containing protein n=1 Tax=Elliptochloris bilobata TaxID=381761 RepID=A0AAW1QN27_9CHLO
MHLKAGDVQLLAAAKAVEALPQRDLREAGPQLRSLESLRLEHPALGCSNPRCTAMHGASELDAVPAPYRRLVQMVACAFYIGECPPYEEPPPGTKAPLRKGTNAAFPGLGAITLDALTRREWVKEDELAQQLKVHPKVLRRVLRYLEQEQLVAREHRREKDAREQPKRGGTPASTAGPEPSGGSGSVAGEALDESEDMPRSFVHSYCALDYARVIDVASLRLHRLRRCLKDAVRKRNPVQEYACPACGARYTSLQALSLIDRADGLFHCEACRTVLVDAEDPGGGDGGGGEGARRERLAEAKALQAKAEAELKPLVELLNDIHRRIADGAKVPDYGTLTDWALAQAQARARAAAIAAGRGGGANGGPGDEMYEARVEIDLADSGAARAGGEPGEARRELPPWLRAQALVAAGGALPGVGVPDTGGTPSAVQAPPEAAASASGAGGRAEDVQAAYVRAYQEKVRLREAGLAARAAAASDDAAAPDVKRPRTDGAYFGAANGAPGVTAERDAVKADPDAQAHKAEAPGAAEEDDVEWEEAGPSNDAAPGGEDEDIEWEAA